jgi:hypothetical protein
MTPRRRVLLEKLMVVGLVKKPEGVTMFRRVHHWSLF